MFVLVNIKFVKMFVLVYYQVCQDVCIWVIIKFVKTFVLVYYQVCQDVCIG